MTITAATAMVTMIMAIIEVRGMIPTVVASTGQTRTAMTKRRIAPAVTAGKHVQEIRL